ncbi:hypothetical protein G3570_15750 [Balneolaceae bacterium YR4-1]|uniref:DUF4834 family protein n=1 Tax=Halalkalibaculum roseum TaxID=2709311 RepID=A0A6M1SYC7_9BACT|nr:hypothetical protein [Halalkalibaculum roseum]NGP78102.1 hypothetical protein [Halalkalibaculum roseum]
MFLKTLAFIVLMYLLVKFVSRLFLPGGRKKNSNARMFYQVFKNIREQKKRHEEQQRRQSKPGGRFDNVEEAEFEEVTEVEPEPETDSNSKSSSSDR